MTCDLSSILKAIDQINLPHLLNSREKIRQDLHDNPSSTFFKEIENLMNFLVFLASFYEDGKVFLEEWSKIGGESEMISAILEAINATSEYANRSKFSEDPNHFKKVMKALCMDKKYTEQDEKTLSLIKVTIMPDAENWAEFINSIKSEDAKKKLLQDSVAIISEKVCMQDEQTPQGNFNLKMETILSCMSNILVSKEI
eukprot:CAMPEP_0114591852 /NCGR_PEP_ID=MMETSP0125-20121206/13813_1 /TAXON_ID=485358 ORGANISM="Aristerostoma sp., Strain ATCC 50986" /NCGR_SAMPLE_ID=MMETSP0125 /ASSEMBLY_ACC=CAM_ASM_000245 /LENGTH=198 /DNA_ID=CAMNT_0001790179 /DNA_START=304 /DNA_END=900 /DNA_ORIENTATION=+